MQGDTFPKKTADVSRYLSHAGVPAVRLVKGPGYFCFEGDVTDDWIDHAVEVTFLADMTCEQWLQTFRAMDANPANRKSVRAARKAPDDEHD